MAFTLKNKVAVAGSARVAKPTPRAVVCQASESRLGLAAAAAAAATLLAQPAFAGVVLQQPELKKVFQSDEAPAPVKERPFRVPGAKPSPAPEVAEAPTKVEQPKKDVEPIGDFGVDPRTVALPGALVSIAALAFAASKVDAGFNDWINESGALVRRSDNYAGFEEDIKGDNYFAPAKAGTKKIGTKKTKKGGK